jgi:hypothetical protein
MPKIPNDDELFWCLSRAYVRVCLGLPVLTVSQSLYNTGFFPPKGTVPRTYMQGLDNVFVLPMRVSHQVCTGARR